jgi:hypothetical protein
MIQQLFQAKKSKATNCLIMASYAAGFHQTFRYFFAVLVAAV